MLLLANFFFYWCVVLWPPYDIIFRYHFYDAILWFHFLIPFSDTIILQVVFDTAKLGGPSATDFNRMPLWACLSAFHHFSWPSCALSYWGEFEACPTESLISQVWAHYSSHNWWRKPSLQHGFWGTSSSWNAYFCFVNFKTCKLAHCLR